MPQHRVTGGLGVSLKSGQVPPATMPVRMQLLSGPSCSVPGIPSSLAATSWPAYLERGVACGAFRYRGLVTSVLPGSFDPVVTDFQWLSPTPANIAMARMAVPHVFRRVRG
jgi:hypothetical protein